MNRVTMYGVAVLVVAAAAAPGAQTKTVQGESRTLTATVESIETARRSLTVKKSDGTYEVFYVPTSVKKFDTVKVGDTVTARYYENVVLRLKPAGEKDADTSASAVTRPAEAAGATAAHQRTITATITAIDPKVPSIAFSGPNGWKYSTRVEDTAALAKVKVGDKVDITWTEALILSLDTGK
jgi:hypothetical protein